MDAGSVDDPESRLARLSLILENAPVVLYGLDSQGRFTFSEGNGLAAMGLRTGQVVGNHAGELYRDNPSAVQAIDAALAGTHAVFEAHFGGAHFVSRLTPIVDDTGAIQEVVGVSVDIGGQVRAERLLGERDEQLRQSQKMEAVGQLAGGIAHDFNNLLTAIIGYSDLLLADEDCESESVRTDVQEIRRAAERAAGLTRQILAFSRRQALQPEIVVVNKLVTETEPLLRRTLGEDIELEVVLEPDRCSIEVDPGQLVQVILNLAINARDAMPDGGRLSIRTASEVVGDDLHTAVADSAPGPYVTLTVSDTGVGMDDETLSHIFEPFFTTKGLGEGTGLGLSTVYGIVRQSGGNIRVLSERGRGTDFMIYFPRFDLSMETAPVVAVPLSLAAAYEVILVVEDEPSVRKLVERVLTSEGYIVLSARDTAQALMLLEESDRSIDLLLTDVLLPGGIKGDALAEKALALRPGLPVLFMSGHPRQLLNHGRGLDQSVNYLQKPFTPGSLSRKVREVLGG